MKRPLRIGITCYPTIGGSGVVATELGKLLAEKGHEVHFITHGIPFRLDQFNNNIYYHQVDVANYFVFKYPPYDLSLASKMAQIAKSKQLDILHVHYAVPHAICAYLAKQMVGVHTLRTVTTLHGTDITVLAQDETLKDVIRLGIYSSDAVTAVSDDLIRQTRELLDIGSSKAIYRAYNFVDKRVYYPRDVAALRAELVPPGEKVLLHMSNFRPVKRTDDVIRIFAKVVERVPARLFLVGEGPELAACRKLIQEFGLEQRVQYLGKQDDVAQVHSLADVFLLPSEKESFGLVALEAMACGVPTVGSLAGGIPELVTHGETGFLAPVGDVEAMAAHVIQLLTDEALYEQVSAACVERARTQFCNDAITAQYENLYYEVLGSEYRVPEVTCD